MTVGEPWCLRYRVVDRAAHHGCIRLVLEPITAVRGVHPVSDSVQTDLLWRPRARSRAGPPNPYRVQSGNLTPPGMSDRPSRSRSRPRSADSGPRKSGPTGCPKVIRDRRRDMRHQAAWVHADGPEADWSPSL